MCVGACVRACVRVYVLACGVAYQLVRCVTQAAGVLWGVPLAYCSASTHLHVLLIDCCRSVKCRGDNVFRESTLVHKANGE